MPQTQCPSPPHFPILQGCPDPPPVRNANSEAPTRFSSFTFPRYLQTVRSQRDPPCPPFKIAQCFLQGVPSGASGKEPTCQCRRQRHRFDPWVGKIPWKRAWQPTLVFLPGEFHGQRSLAGYSPWVAKSRI